MILRDKSEITRMLILLELLKGRRKLREIAENIDITVQGVSEYLRWMERDGLVKNGEITIKGMEFLTNALDELGDFLVKGNAIVRKVGVIEAVAGESIKKGDEVRLVMENGYIHAYRGSGKSSGIAINSARKGEDLGVTNLAGLLNIKYGEITVYTMPSVEEGGTRKVSKDKIKKIIDKNPGAMVGACGVVAYLALKKAGAKIDFQFSAVNSAIDAHYRGISTLLFVSHMMLPHSLSTLEEKGVPYSLKTV